MKSDEYLLLNYPIRPLEYKYEYCTVIHLLFRCITAYKILTILTIFGWIYFASRIKKRVITSNLQVGNLKSEDQ